MNKIEIFCLIIIIILFGFSVFLLVKNKENYDSNNGEPIFINKSIIGRDMVFYLPMNGKERSFLCKVPKPSHTDFYDEIGIIGQNRNGTTLSGFSKDYNIMYSFYEDIDYLERNRNRRTWESLVSPNKWNGLVKPYVFVRERDNMRDPDWKEGWLQINVYPVGKSKRANV